jgi:hypothetical protein
MITTASEAQDTSPAIEKVKKHGGVFFVMESTHAFRQTDPLVEELHLEDQVQEAPADG